MVWSFNLELPVLPRCSSTSTRVLTSWILFLHYGSQLSWSTSVISLKAAVVLFIPVSSTPWHVKFTSEHHLLEWNNDIPHVNYLKQRFVVTIELYFNHPFFPSAYILNCWWSRLASVCHCFQIRTVDFEHVFTILISMFWEHWWYYRIWPWKLFTCNY